MSKATVLERRPITTGLVTMLGTATAVPPEVPLRPVGDPDFIDEHGQPWFPSLKEGYLVVHSIPGGTLNDGPPLGGEYSEGEFVYQVDTVGSLRSHVEWLADRVRLSLVSRNPDGSYQVAFPHPPGWKVIRRQAEVDGAPGVDVGGTVENRVFSVSERFRLYVVPNPQ